MYKLYVESYQRLKKWYLLPRCLKLSIVRYRSRVKWTSQGNGVASSAHHGVAAIEKGAFGLHLTKVAKKSLLIYIYIYIYCHPQTDCFVLSELFSVARHVGRSKPGSKPIQIYVRLNLRPLGRQADHVDSGNFKVFI